MTTLAPETLDLTAIEPDLPCDTIPMPYGVEGPPCDLPAAWDVILSCSGGVVRTKHKCDHHIGTLLSPLTTSWCGIHGHDHEVFVIAYNRRGGAR